MEHREDIEQLFKSTFAEFEADVHPDAWVNIQNGLNVPPVSNPASIANNVATGAKVAAVSSKAIIMAVTAIVGITASVIYFSSDNMDAETTPANEIKIIESIVPVTESTDAENKNFSDASTLKTEPQPVSVKQESANEIDNKISTAENSAFTSSTNEDVAVANENKKNDETVSEEKNKDLEVKLQNNAAQPALSVNDEQQKASENEIQDVSPGQDAEEGMNTASPAKEEEKAIDEYLGKIVNVITPNSDGDNDAFVIEGTDLVTLKVSIMDRSGKIIHEWNNLHGFWDGKLKNGEPAPAGTYFYNIFAQTKSGTPLSKTGSLHLLIK